MTIPNGETEFQALLTQVMQQHNLSEVTLAQRLGVSTGAVNRWMHGKQPRDSMREMVLTKLKAPPTIIPPEPKLGVHIAIDGPGLRLQMDVTADTAQKIIQVLFGSAV